MNKFNSVLLALIFAISAIAFSSSAMAASDSKSPSGDTESKPEGVLDISKIPDPFAHRPSWCNNWPGDKLKPQYFYQVCGFK
ncbi:TPA: hypothetical protein N3A45_003675 [Salmonella enterica subsp. salamae serovar [1],40:z35:e,n,x,z15]|nr:hypothetical protein [Salmonella enterica subsp. salamae serovar 40:c:e,n,x,z15]EIU8982216.1 hypothetical protein [Salmonella enterica]EJH2658699.1 hypothetical protein [Salmonella enterica]HCL5350018.1 hypothetical protein [Salmonella enterica]HCM2000524.1 hypothetical protein [Salmonella enterica subsp. salamae serovar [1],40:z35:e,n,x,z15]